MPRTGRRPGDSGSRDAIAAAARRQFAEGGFEGTTIRGIAREAGVDPALVIRFFGSKDALFATCVDWPFDPTTALDAILAAPRAELGEQLTRLFVRTWDAEDGRNTIVSLLRAAMTHEAAERLLRNFLVANLFDPLAATLDGPDAPLRVSLAQSELLGMCIARHVLRLEPLASLDPEALVARVAPAVQRHQTGPLPAG